jgi:hypothetical protein
MALSASASASAAGPSWTGGVELQLRANAYPSAPDATLSSAACAQPGVCTAVGAYADNAGIGRALAATTSAGPGWLSSELLLPDSADADNPDAARCAGTTKPAMSAKRSATVLAKATYSLARGKSKTIAVRLTKAGRKAFAHSRARRVARRSSSR